jgi:hypothetical protein
MASAHPSVTCWIGEEKAAHITIKLLLCYTGPNLIRLSLKLKGVTGTERLPSAIRKAYEDFYRIELVTGVTGYESRQGISITFLGFLQQNSTYRRSDRISNMKNERRSSLVPLSDRSMAILFIADITVITTSEKKTMEVAVWASSRMERKDLRKKIK